MIYRPITDLTELHLPDGSIVFKESLPNRMDGLGEMKDPNRGKKVGSYISTIGGAVAVVAPPISTVVGGIISAVGALISAFSNTKATQKANAEAGKYEQANFELQTQNQQLDVKIKELQSSIIEAKKYFGLDPNKSLTGHGLGWCLVNCAKNDAKERLKNAKQLFEQLNNAQDDRISIIEQLTAEAERLFLKKTKLNYVYIGAGVLVFGSLVYLLTKKSN